MISDSHSTSPSRQIDYAGQAGFLAAIAMVAVQLIWRLGWSRDGVVQAFPEFVVAAISRLTPISLFGAATETYGSLAKKCAAGRGSTGHCTVGMWAAARPADWPGDSAAVRRRLAAAAIVAGALLLVTLVGILPLANLGYFARHSSDANAILVRLVVTFGLYALLWAVFTDEIFEPEPDFTREQVTRRAFVLDLATLAGVAVAGGAIWRIVQPHMPRVSDTAAQQAVDEIVATQRAGQGYELKTPTPTGTPRETAMLTSDLVRQANDPLALFAELDAEGTITPVLTATPDFYHVSKNLIDPTVSAGGWSLKITGLVDHELEFTHEQLMERATVQRITTLCCISNQLNGDLISTAQWNGIPLADLLNEAGIRDGAIDLKFHAADGYEDSVGIDVGLHESNLVVVGMNGEPLPDDHGFPARLIVPNIYGMKNVKWLDTIEVVDHDFKGYWESVW